MFNPPVLSITLFANTTKRTFLDSSVLLREQESARVHINKTHRRQVWRVRHHHQAYFDFSSRHATTLTNLEGKRLQIDTKRTLAVTQLSTKGVRARCQAHVTATKDTIYPLLFLESSGRLWLLRGKLLMKSRARSNSRACLFLGHFFGHIKKSVAASEHGNGF